MNETIMINFNNDNFTSRRGNRGAGVAYDPQSLITQGEVDAGLDYNNSRRVFPGPAMEQDCIVGNWTTEEVLDFAPRVRTNAIEK